MKKIILTVAVLLDFASVANAMTPKRCMEGTLGINTHGEIEIIECKKWVAYDNYDVSQSKIKKSEVLLKAEEIKKRGNKAEIICDKMEKVETSNGEKLDVCVGKKVIDVKEIKTNWYEKFLK